MEEARAGGRAVISEERALEGIFEERALENLKPPQGWMGPVGMTERGEGAFRTPAQSPSQSNPPPFPAVPDVESAHPQPRCIRVAGGVSYTQEQSSMVLERSVPLLQQEEEEFGPDEGIHGDTQRKQKTEKKR